MLIKPRYEKYLITLLGCDNRLTIYFKQVPQDLYAYLIILFQTINVSISPLVSC